MRFLLDLKKYFYESIGGNGKACRQAGSTQRGKEAFFLRRKRQAGSRGQYMKAGGCCNLMSFVFLVE